MKKFRVVVNNSEYQVEIEEIKEDGGSQPTPRIAQQAAPAAQPAPKPAPKAASSPPAESGAAAGAITAPMPGTILRVNVASGDNVTQGQTLLVLEAMKMENEIQAPADGVVQDLKVAEGVSVNAGDTLIVLS